MRDDGDLAEAYLDLVKQHLTRGSYRVPTMTLGDRRWQVFSRLQWIASRFGLELVKHVDADARDQGLDRSSDADTMIGRRRLDNLHHCVTDVLANQVPGDFIETGVWRGGASIFMRAILRASHDTSRTVWVADSFQGLPRPDPDRYPADRGDRLWRMTGLAVSLDEVKANFARYGLLDDQVRFLEGWFSETLPTAPIERLAVMRLDGDMYESTMDALKALYPKLSVGGYVIVDDFGAIEACRQAVNDFRAANAIDDEISSIDWTGAYWRRARA